MSSRKRRSKRKIKVPIKFGDYVCELNNKKVNKQDSIDKHDLGDNEKEIDDVYAGECFEDAKKMEECSGDVLSNSKECLDTMLEDGCNTPIFDI
ncbi:hypothetical protein Tco_0713098 [Tanacetum coccineum]